MGNAMQEITDMYKGFDLAREWFTKFGKPMTIGDMNMPTKVYQELEKQFFDRKKANGTTK